MQAFCESKSASLQCSLRSLQLAAFALHLTELQELVRDIGKVSDITGYIDPGNHFKLPILLDHLEIQTIRNVSMQDDSFESM